MRVLSLLALVAWPAPADACTRGWRDCDNGYLEDAPRNARFLPGTCTWERVERVIPAPEGLPDLDARPAEASRVPFGRTRKHPLGIVALAHPFLLPADGRFTAGGTDFTTTRTIDHARPEGGAFVDLLGPPGAFLLVFTPVVDESPVFLVLESWHREAPETTRVAATREFQVLDPAAPGLGRDRQRVAWTPEQWALLEPLGAAVVAPQSLGWSDCGSFGLQPLLDARYDTLLVRTRWMDAAGNSGPWSEPRAFPTGPR